jgi:hypothetical protein
MASHGELARTRPPARYLTGFYVALSFGGMIGGLFAGLVAPFTFSWVAEYPILLALAALCRPPQPARRGAMLLWLATMAVALVLIALAYRTGAAETLLESWRVWAIGAVAAAAALLAITMRLGRFQLAALVALGLVLVRVYPLDEGRVETVRSFFGVHKIVVTPGGQYHVLMHGTTIHGAEKFLNDDGTRVTGRPEPISYYHDDGGIGRAIAAIRARKGAPLRVAAIGLGAGTLACQAQPNETWKFFEIDQTMVDTARNPKYFTYLSACMPDIKPVIGDARLTFAREPDATYDLIIVDAYSSDAIPIHLATKEAMAIYKAKLAPGGAVVMHVSNRHLELASVVVGIADANGMTSWVYNEDSGRDAEYIFTTNVVVSARKPEDVGSLASDSYWQSTPPTPGEWVWTDDYSNVLGAVYRRLRDGDN